MDQPSRIRLESGPSLRILGARNTPALWAALLFSVAIIWGGQFIAIKYLVQYVSPFEVITLRFVPVALVFAVWLLPTRGREIWQMIRAERGRFLLLGLTGAIVNNACLGWGLTHTAAGTASLMISLGPVFTYAFSLLALGERFQWRRALGMAVAFAGVFVIIRWGSGRAVTLDEVGYTLLVLVSPCSWAIYTVTSKSVAERHPPLLVTGAFLMIAGAFSLVFVRPSLLPQLQTAPPAFWASVLFMAVPSTIYGFMVWARALERMPAERVASYLYWVPLFAVLFGHWLFNEPVTAALILGAAILILGVWLVNRR
jgi:drug/metabolite transporter (DMT)-like permease